MSRIKKVAAMKKKRLHRKSGGALLLEVFIKEEEARQRLGNSCCVFVKNRDIFRFLVMADNAPDFQTPGNFFSVAIGASNIEVEEAKNILNELSSEWASTFDVKDFYPRVALHFLSKYLKNVTEEFFSPRALAVEYMIFDPTLNTLYAIKFNGDYELYNLNETEKTFIVIGAFDMRFKRELAQKIQKHLDDDDTGDEELKKITSELCRKYDLRFSVLLCPEVINKPLSGTQKSTTLPGLQIE